MKEVFIVRHGPAVNVGESGVRRDADRVLSEDGRKKTREAAEGLRSLECRPALIASSPLIRAIETADIFADVLQVRNDVLRLPAIGSPIKLEEALSWIRAQREFPVMLVGHMPGLSDLASCLVSGSSGAAFAMKKASVTCIAFDGKPAIGAGNLEWFIPPKVLRGLGKNA